MAIERKKIPTHTTTWTNVKDIILNDRSQSQKGNTFDSHFLRYLTAVKFIETESRRVIVAWGSVGLDGEQRVFV